MAAFSRGRNGSRRRAPCGGSVGACGSGSSFARSCWMKLSMVRGVPWWAGPQTLRKMSSRLMALPRASTRHRRTSNSVAVISTDDACLADLACLHVDDHVVEGDGALRRRAAPEGRAHAGEQLGQAERLGHVVLGAQLEPRDLVHLPVARGQHDDGHRVALLAQGVEHLEAVLVREHHVEDDEVGRARPRAASRPTLAVALDEDEVALLLEVDAQTQGDARIVLDDEDRAPACTVGPAAVTRLRKGGHRSIRLAPLRRGLHCSFRGAPRPSWPGPPPG